MSGGPLDGISVIELAGIGPGPFACGMLADLGADVVRIERPGGGRGLPSGADRIGVRNRVVVSLDLKSETGMAHAQTLIRQADVLLEGFRPGVAERMGIGPDAILAMNPALVYARMTGWGQDGPYAMMAGHDINYIGLTGVLAAIGTDAPTPPLNLVADYGGGGMLVVVGILAALVERASSGRGQVVDAAMVDGASTLLGPIRDLHNLGLWRRRRSANLLDGGAPFYRTYRTSDGGYMAVGALEEAFYEEVLTGLGLDASDLPNRMDPDSWPDLASTFERRFATRTRDEWTAVFDGTDACVTPVLEMGEVADHPHNAARRALVPGPHGPVPAPSPRLGTSEVRSRADRPVSDTLVALGLSTEIVEQLEQSGAAYRV